MSTKRRQKKAPVTMAAPVPPKDNKHDRFTLSVFQGYADWLDRLAKSKNLDKSKMARIAIEEWIHRHYTEIDHDLIREFEHLRRGHGPGRYGGELL